MREDKEETTDNDEQRTFQSVDNEWHLVRRSMGWFQLGPTAPVFKREPESYDDIHDVCAKSSNIYPRLLKPLS